MLQKDFGKTLAELYDKRRVIDTEINLLISDIFKAAGMRYTQQATATDDAIVGPINEENK